MKGKPKLVKVRELSVKNVDFDKDAEWKWYQSIRILYHIADYILDYYLRLRPWKSKNCLILSERYAYKYLAAPQVHIPKAPKLLRYLACILVPKPDITILLHAEPEVILNRKRELTKETIIEQQQEYRKIGKFVSDYHIVDNERKPEIVVDEVVSILLHKTEKIFST